MVRDPMRNGRSQHRCWSYNSRSGWRIHIIGHPSTCYHVTLLLAQTFNKHCHWKEILAANFTLVYASVLSYHCRYSQHAHLQHLTSMHQSSTHHMHCFTAVPVLLVWCPSGRRSTERLRSGRRAAVEMKQHIIHAMSGAIENDCTGYRMHLFRQAMTTTLVAIENAHGVPSVRFLSPLALAHILLPTDDGRQTATAIYTCIHDQSLRMMDSWPAWIYTSGWPN